MSEVFFQGDQLTIYKHLEENALTHTVDTLYEIEEGMEGVPGEVLDAHERLNDIDYLEVVIVFLMELRNDKVRERDF